MQSISTDVLIGGGQSPRTAAALLAVVEAQIMAGTLAAGDRLPPVRAAAADLDLAPNTVAAAYRQLSERGLVTGEGRRGTFVADRGPAEPRVTAPIGSGLVNLADGNPDHGLLPDLGIALRTIAADHVRYGQDPIDERLGRLFVADLSPDLAGHRGHDVIPGETLAVVAGALDGIERTLAAHLRPGDRVGVEDPGYAAVIQLVKALNLRPVAVPIDDAGPQPEGVADALAQGIRALIVTPRAQNPTGAAITADRAAILADLLADHPDVLLIEDDHAGPVAGAPYHSLIPAAADRWAVIRSVAKSLGPDLRLAALVADRTTHGRVANRQLLGTGWVSHLLQRTVAALLDPMGPAPAPADRFVTAAETYRARRAHLLNALDLHGIPATGPSGLNVWVPVPDEGAVVAALQQRGYAVLAGARFRLLSGPAIRISTGSATEVQLDGVANALGEALATGPAGRSV